MSEWERRYKTAVEQTEIAMKTNEQLIKDKHEREVLLCWADEYLVLVQKQFKRNNQLNNLENVGELRRDIKFLVSLELRKRHAQYK